MSERCVPRAQLQFAQIVVRTILNAMPRSSGATRPRNGNLPATFGQPAHCNNCDVRWVTLN
jgi:hypothetical protein